MRYMLLLNNGAEEVAHWTALDREEAERLRAAEMPKWNALFAWMGEQGLQGEGLELDDPSKARVVRVVDDQPVVTDGPYAETKEVIGGYFVVECNDLDEAIEFARRIPLVERGSVEIRPLAE